MEKAYLEISVMSTEISRYKTTSIFDRYNIVSDQDLKEAVLNQQIYFESPALKEEQGPRWG